MKGNQLTFFTQQDRRHDGQPIGEWLLQLAKSLGLRGATMLPASEGFGASRRIHSARFFELTDQPIEVVLVATEEETARLFDALRAAAVDMFYVRTPVEFGHIAGN